MSKRMLTAAAVACVAGLTADGRADVTHGHVDVVQLNGANTGSVVVTAPVGSPGFGVLASSNRGDFDLSTNMTVPGGIVMTTPRQNGRDNDAVGGGLGGTDGAVFGGVRYATTAIETVSGTRYSIPVFDTSNSSNAGGDEFNMNVAAAYFPYADGYLGGLFRNAAGTNGGPNDQLITGNAALQIGTHVVDLSTAAAPQAGRTLLDFTSLQAQTRTGPVAASSLNGILLVTGGKNEDNYAAGRANADGTFTAFVHDNGVDSSSFEQDHLAFVYLAANDSAAVAMGRILNDGSPVAGTNSGLFTVTKGGAGNWFLTITGQNDSTGTLIVSPETSDSGNTIDNVLSYEWDPANARWIIQTRDLPGTALQDAGTGVPAFSFAFFPVPEPSTAALLAPAGLLALRRVRRRRRAEAAA